MINLVDSNSNLIDIISKVNIISKKHNNILLKQKNKDRRIIRSIFYDIII